MKYPNKAIGRSLNNIELYEGESIEERIRKMTESGEPINDTQPLIYTEKKDGIISAYDIRRDKWDEAIEMTDTTNTAMIDKKIKTVDAPKTEEKPKAPADN